MQILGVISMQREIFLEKTRQTEEAMQKTKSKYCRKDLAKSLRRMKRALREYDRYHDESGGANENSNG